MSSWQSQDILQQSYAPESISTDMGPPNAAAGTPDVRLDMLFDNVMTTDRTLPCSRSVR